MPISSKALKRAAIALPIAAVLGFVVVRTWVVPVVIAGQIRARVGGKVTIRDWWLDGRSAGVVGLSLHEGPGAGSSAWATAERVETDLSLRGLLRGRFTPRRVSLVRPVLDFRLDRDGRFRNLPEFRGGGGGPSRVPEVVAQDARVIFRQEGRPEMVVSGVSGRLRPGPGVLVVSAEADDPSWGRWAASGAIDPGFGKGSVRLDGERVAADPKKLAGVPFVPPDVWANVAPTGPARVALVLGWGIGGVGPVRTRVEVTFLGTRGAFPTLGLVTTGTTGRLVVEDGVVRVEHVEGESLGGRVAASGVLDFSRTPPRFDLALALDKVNVADAPKTWQLDEAGVTGLLTGKVKLRAVLAATGVDLSGTSGEGVVEGGTIQGIPFKTLKLAMQASGNDLQYNTKAAGEARADGPLRRLVGLLVALQPPHPEPKAGGVKLPRTITTQLELEDVDVTQLIGRAQMLLGAPIPVPITGRMSLKAEATIPLGALKDLKGYVFHGDVTLTGASIFRVDFGRLASRIDLADGVLELTDLRGRLVDLPDGGPDNPPEASLAVAARGPLPPGGFRAHVRAELSPPGRLAVRFDGNQLPLGELGAPVLPRPTPLSGLATIGVEAAADLRAARDPSSWTASGQVESVHISYRGAALDGASLRFDLKRGGLNIQELSARLLGRPLVARGQVDLRPPRSFRGTLDVTEWDLAALLAVIPGAAPRAGRRPSVGARRGEGDRLPLVDRDAGPGPARRVPRRSRASGRRPLPVDDPGGRDRPVGRRGAPVRRDGHGRGPRPDRRRQGDRGDGDLRRDRRLADHRRDAGAGPQALGQGRRRGQVRDPRRREGAGGDRAAVGARPGGPGHPGRAGPRHGAGAAGGAPVRGDGRQPRRQGQVPGRLPPDRRAGGPPRGRSGGGRRRAPRRRVHARPGLEGAGHDRGPGAPGGPGGDRRQPAGRPGRARAGPLRARGGRAARPELGRVPAGPPPRDRREDAGLVAGRAPLRRHPRGAGERVPLGDHARAGRRRLGFDLRLDRASLKQALAFEPTLARNLDGDGTVHMAGDLGETFRATAEVDVANARFAGLPVTELRAPAELSLVPETGSGVLQVRRWSSRLAGGQLRGDAWFHLGEDRAFRAEVQLAALDLQAIARLMTDARRPASGRISGTVSLSGPDPSLPSGYRGRVVLDLDDASLVALPIVNEIDRFLGSARGGCSRTATSPARSPIGS